MKLKGLIAFILLVSLTSCWPTSVSFKDTGSLHECLKVFTMDPLELNAPNAPINYNIDLTEAIKTGVQNNTRLMLGTSNANSQVSITGKIVSYSITPVALQQGDVASKNRLTVAAAFDIVFDCPKDNYSLDMKLTSSRFADYDVSQDISSIERSLLEEINAQIVQDVINKILSNW